MASLLEKVDTLIRANLHALVDRALKANSLAVIDQYVRQIEDNIEELEDAAATVGGQVKTLKRKVEEYTDKVNELDRNIDVFLREGREELALAAQSKLNSTQRLLDNYKEQLARQESEYQKLLGALEAWLAKGPPRAMVLHDAPRPYDPRTPQEILKSIQRNRWTPPPGTPSALEMLREDRER